MATYEIYLIKVWDRDMGHQPQIDEADVSAQVEALFNRVIQEGPVAEYEQSHVNWQTTCTPVQDHELVVYILQDSMDSVVAARFSNTFPDIGGTTAWGGRVVGTGSEVYINGCNRNPLTVANMVFHEAMHNKGHWSNERLHGGFGGGGLASHTIAADTELTAVNIQRMASVLTRRRPQWMSGCEYANDPMRGLSSLVPDQNFRHAVATYSGAVRGGSYLPSPLVGLEKISSRG